MDKSQLEQVAHSTLQICKDDGFYQAVNRLLKCKRAYLLEISHALEIDPKMNKFYLAKKIVQTIQKQWPQPSLNTNTAMKNENLRSCY